MVSDCNIKKMVFNQIKLFKEEKKNEDNILI